MNFGFNSNVRVGDALYHVQTEDRGPAHPFIDTVVYESGRVVHKVSNPYVELLEAGAGEKLHERLSQQHRGVISDLETGALKIQLTQPVTSAAAAPEGLQIRILNPGSWLIGENATLELQLQSGVSGEAASGAEVEGFLEADRTRSLLAATHCDDHSRATLTFLLPATVADGTALVIRATDGSLYGELRFRLKAKRRQTAPVLP